MCASLTNVHTKAGVVARGILNSRKVLAALHAHPESGSVETLLPAARRRPTTFSSVGSRPLPRTPTGQGTALAWVQVFVKSISPQQYVTTIDDTSN